LVPVLLKGLWDLLNRSIWPIGFGYLLLWTLFILCFVPNTPLLDRNIAYALWLVFSVLMVLGVTSCVDTPDKFEKVMRWYIYSYGFSAVFGLSQFVLPLIGLHPFLVQQWWFPDTLARINGFTYEPSYYASYMIAGWVTIDYLRYKKCKIPHIEPCFWLVTIALVLSTSRMGWIVMLLWLALRMFWSIRQGTFRWRRMAAAGFVAGLLILTATVWVGLRTADLSFLINGLGLMEDSGSYSSEERWDLTKQTLEIYVAHPIIGVSLGGIAPIIGQNNGVAMNDNEDAKTTEGQCTTAEVLAASGTIGFVFYFLYMSGLLRITFRSSNDFVKALGFGFIFLLIILQFNQNILRFYLWFHIALLSAAYRVSSAASQSVSPTHAP
jgi:hypothetical protein